MAKKPTSSKTAAALVSIEGIEERIYVIRGRKVMLDSDLAELYGVETRSLNQAVKRNLKRFPADFMCQLTPEEAQSLRSQIVISNVGRGGRRFTPYAFTEHGAVMLASVLNSNLAVEASIHVVRAFVRLRSILAAHKDLERKLEALEKKTTGQFTVVFKLLAQIIQEEEQPKRQIGFGLGDKEKQ